MPLACRSATFSIRDKTSSDDIRTAPPVGPAEGLGVTGIETEEVVAVLKAGAVVSTPMVPGAFKLLCPCREFPIGIWAVQSHDRSKIGELLLIVGKRIVHCRRQQQLGPGAVEIHYEARVSVDSSGVG